MYYTHTLPFPTVFSYVRLHIEGSRPEWCISTIYHACDTPFWLGTLELCCTMPATVCAHIKTSKELNFLKPYQLSLGETQMYIQSCVMPVPAGLVINASPSMMEWC